MTVHKMFTDAKVEKQLRDELRAQVNENQLMRLILSCHLRAEDEMLKIFQVMQGSSDLGPNTKAALMEALAQPMESIYVASGLTDIQKKGPEAVADVLERYRGGLEKENAAGIDSTETEVQND